MPVAARYVAWRQCRTDSKGAFRFAGLAAGSYQIITAMSGGVRIEQSIEVPRGSCVDNVEVSLDLGLSIEGEVRAFDGSLTDRVYLQIKPLDGQDSQHPIFSAPRGRFVIRGLTRGRYRVEVSPMEKRIGLATSCECRAGDLGVQLTLGGATAIDGRVVDRVGKPVTGVRVLAAECQGGQGRWWADVDAEGRFRIELPVNRRVDLRVMRMAPTRVLRLGSAVELLEPAVGVGLLSPLSDVVLTVK